MKHIIKFLILVIVLHNSSLFAVMTVASITQNIITSTSVTRKNMYIISDTQNYTTGGLTFTYPSNIFIASPIVHISILPNASHPNTETYTVEVNSNSMTSTTIMVYKVSAGLIAEAPNGSVMINLLAIENPA